MHMLYCRKFINYSNINNEKVLYVVFCMWLNIGKWKGGKGEEGMKGKEAIMYIGTCVHSTYSV